MQHLSSIFIHIHVAGIGIGEKNYRLQIVLSIVNQRMFLNFTCRSNIIAGYWFNLKSFNVC